MSKRNVVVAAFLLFFIFTFIAMLTVIYNTPVEITNLTGGNYTGNLMNDGYILEDSGFLFFINKQDNSIIRTETDNFDKKVKISNNSEGFLQLVGSRYYFLDNGALISCDIDGNYKTTVIEFAKKPWVLGDMIYYLNKEGFLCRYSNVLKSEKVFEVKPNGEFMVYLNTIYYLDSKGNIRQMNSNGNNDRLLLESNVTKLLIEGKFFFYLSDGYVYSAEMTKQSLYSTKITKATDFSVQKQYILFCNNDKVYLADLNELIDQKDDYQPQEVLNEKAFNLSTDGKNFYFYNDDNYLYRINKDGKDLIKIH